MWVTFSTKVRLLLRTLIVFQHPHTRCMLRKNTSVFFGLAACPYLCRPAQQVFNVACFLLEMAPTHHRPRNGASFPSNPRSPPLRRPITKIHARQIFDSRGNPTVEVDLSTELGMSKLTPITRCRLL